MVGGGRSKTDHVGFLVKSVLCFRARSDFGVSEGCNRGLRDSAWTGPGGGFRRPAHGGRRASGLEQKRLT